MDAAQRILVKRLKPTAAGQRAGDELIRRKAHEAIESSKKLLAEMLKPTARS